MKTIEEIAKQHYQDYKEGKYVVGGFTTLIRNGYDPRGEDMEAFWVALDECYKKDKENS